MAKSDDAHRHEKYRKKSPARGVYWNYPNQKWTARIYINKHWIELGNYAEWEDASKVYERAHSARQEATVIEKLERITNEQRLVPARPVRIKQPAPIKIQKPDKKKPKVSLVTICRIIKSDAMDCEIAEQLQISVKVVAFVRNTFDQA